MKPLGTAISAACLALALGACGGQTNEPGNEPAVAANTTVEIADFAFDPDPLDVSVGEKVTWTNTDDILHTVTSGVPKEQGVPGVSKDKAADPDGLFDERLDLDATYTFTFDEPGEYTYFCDIHAGMQGTVVVTS